MGVPIFSFSEYFIEMMNGFSDIFEHLSQAMMRLYVEIRHYFLGLKKLITGIFFIP
jgi:hypothetical protein